jgi:hypothetical protein
MRAARQASQQPSQQRLPPNLILAIRERCTRTGQVRCPRVPMRRCRSEKPAKWLRPSSLLRPVATGRVREGNALGEQAFRAIFDAGAILEVLYELFL